MAAMRILNSKRVLMPLFILLLASCSVTKAPTNATKNSPVISTGTSLVLADGITVTQAELDGKSKYIDTLDEILPDASPKALLVEKQILQLGSPAEKFKNDGTMQAIMSYMSELKTDSDLISLAKINKAISDKEMALGDAKNKWLCRLTRSTIWLCAVRGSLMHGEQGTNVLTQTKTALAPLDTTEERDFAGMEKWQHGLK